ncbi:MAG: guanylate kinase [Steroidobacteraceae bacterium]
MAGGRLFVVAAPSGAGKTSLVKALLEREPRLRVCVSHTTRAQRPNEQDGRDYHFVSVARFREIEAADGFLEHAQVFDNFYGTSLMALEQAFGQGFDVVLEIDWQGAQQVRRKVPACVTIFILPPSRRALEERLRNRRTDSDAVIARRLRDAVGDMSHYGEFDRVVVNDDFETAVADLQRIVAGRGDDLGPGRPALAPLLADLLAAPAAG